ncbi:MAG: CHAT domain-containing protein [Bryobacteraceae bacterium]
MAAFAALLALAGCGSGELASELLERSIRASRDGNASEALALAERAQQQTRSEPCDPMCWRIRVQRAECLLARGELGEAAKLLDPQPPAAAEFRTVLQRRAFAQAARWRRERNIEKLLADSRSCLEAKTTDPGTYLECLVVRAIGIFDSGKREEGIRLTEQAAREAAALGDSFHETLALGNLSFEYLREYRYDDAAAAGAAAVKVSERGEGALARTNALTNLGAAYRQVGDFERSLAVLDQALSGIPPDNPLRRLQVLNEAGLTHWALGQRKEAADTLRQALALARKGGGAEDRIRVSGNLSLVASESGDLPTARAATEEMAQVIAAARSPSPRAVALLDFRRARLAWAEGRTIEALAMLRAVTKQPLEKLALKDAYYYIALIHRELGDARAASDSFRKAIAVVEESRAELARIDSQISYLTQPIRMYQSFAAHLEAQGDREGAFRVQESIRARVLAGSSSQPASLLQTQGLARRSGVIFLSYWLDREHPMARIISGSHHEVIALPGKASRIEALVRRHRQIVEDDFGDPVVEGSAASRELSDLLLLPVQRAIPPGSRVVVIPDGALHALNFETLPGPGAPPRYWIEDVTLSVAPFHALEPRSGAAPGSRSLLLFGDPQWQGSGFRQLDHARDEIEAVRAGFGASAVIRSGPSATPAAWPRSEPARFTHVHFTAHAKARSDAPLESFIVLSPSGGENRLFARSILSTPLRAELVTLSACQSANGRAFAGEGMIGLSWALLHAGAGNVIAGLWDVADQSTTGLMASLYEGLAQRSPPANALRSAKLRLLASKGNYRKPFYWGPFQTYSRILSLR